MEKPYIPFYKPYGMTDEEYLYEVQLAEQRYAEWEEWELQQKQTMKTLLWLDDIRNPFDKDFTPYVALYNPFLNQPHEIIWVKNYDEFLEYLLSESLPDAISFDHDLADEHYNGDIKTEDYKEKTGMNCVKFLVDLCADIGQKLPICIYHTGNSAGKVNMETYINNAKKHLGL